MKIDSSELTHQAVRKSQYPEEKYPVVATTSELMTTGVDAQTCKVIVLDANINSMTKFKQIVGRGTRINEEFNKLYFTIKPAKTMETMVKSLIRMLTDGPEVSLNGSPTVSPTTAAL